MKFTYKDLSVQVLRFGAILIATVARTSPVVADTHTVTPTFHGDIPAYTEQAIAAGIEHRYDGPWEYFVGGGVATFDCNNDRMPDVFVAGGVKDSALYINVSKTGQALEFQLQDSTVSKIKQVTGAYPINLDSDDFTDLVITRVGENRILKGGPDCSFKFANAHFAFDGGNAWTTAFSASYEQDSHYPTLAFGNYVDRTAAGSPWGTCEDNVLIRPLYNRTDDGQVDKSDPGLSYATQQPLSPGHCALSLLFTDWNKSGRDALRITNDRQYYRGGQEQMWRLDSGLYPRLYRRADGWEPLIIWGMGIAEGDLNADGYPEYLLTSMGDTKLQSVDVAQASEENRPAYEDIAYSRGATAHRPYTGGDIKPSTGWHAEFADINNDSLLDIFITKGNVERMSDFAAYDPDNLLLSNHRNQFTETGEPAGLALNTRGRGASVTDFNADGLLDILVVNRSANISLFRHTGFHSEFGVRKGGNWLAVELNQTGQNKHALGAQIAIKTGNKTQVRKVQLGGGHASGAHGFTHVGLGVAERATVRVKWPDGEWSAPYRVFANQFAVLKRNDNHVSYWYPVTTEEQ